MMPIYNTEEKRVFPSRYPAGKVCRGFALCVSLSPRPNLCEYEQKLQWPLQQQRNGTSAGSPSSGCRVGGQKRAGICPPAPDDPINNLSEIGVISIIPWASGGALLLFLSARIKLALNLPRYFNTSTNNINNNNIIEPSLDYKWCSLFLRRLFYCKYINGGNALFMILVGLLLFYSYTIPVLMCARLTAWLIIDLRSFCFIGASPPASPPPLCVKCHNDGGGEAWGEYDPLPLFLRFCNPK